MRNEAWYFEGTGMEARYRAPRGIVRDGIMISLESGSCRMLGVWRRARFKLRGVEQR